MKKSINTINNSTLDAIMVEGLNITLKSLGDYKKPNSHIEGLTAMKIVVTYQFGKFMKEINDKESYEFLQNVIKKDYNSLTYKKFQNYVLKSCPEIKTIVQ